MTTLIPLIGLLAMLEFNMAEFHSVPPELAQTSLSLWSDQEFSSREWVLHHAPAADFDRGIRGGFWRDMHRNPTVALTGLALDWSKCRAIRVVLESEAASNNVITLAFRSDNPEAKGRGYFYFEIPLDFTGEKEFDLSFADAGTINRPAGWGAVSGIYLFAKANGHRPSPYASMRLKSIRPQEGEFTPAKIEPERYLTAYPDRPTPNLNHAFPEDQADGPVVTARSFITYQHHGRNERDLFAYYPRYNPGYVSFSPAGKAYIASGELIQWLEGGRWQTFSLRKHLERWAEEKGYAGLRHNWGAQGGDPVVRFDRDGGIYLLAQLEALNEAGERYDRKTRTALLLFTPDHFKTVLSYELPLPVATFEKVDGNNPDALDRPPVVMLSDYSYFDDAYRGLRFIAPKRNGGELEIGKAVEVAETAIGCNYHSGDGNIVLTSGNKLFIIWGWIVENWPQTKRCQTILAELERLRPGEKDLWTADNLAQTRWGKSLPASYPAPDAPERNMKFDSQYHHPFYSRFSPSGSNHGVPTFLTTYDLATGEKSAPVYLGSAGSNLDGHNWGAISFDPAGHIEVLLNGHHNPPQYTRSAKPFSAEAFEPVRFLQPEQHQERLSYGSLNCDAGGTLYSFHRSTTGVYNNRLVMFRKKTGQSWEPARTIVAPSKLLYHVWMHKAAINPRNGWLYLAYLGFSPQSFWTPDYYETMRFIYPEIEETLPGALDPERMKLREIRHWDSWETGGIVTGVRGGEAVILVSKDGGETWSLARSGDFQ